MALLSFNRTSAALIGSFALVLAGCGGSGDSSEGPRSDTASETEETSASETVTDAAETTQETIEEAADTIADAAGNAADTMADVQADVADAAEGVMDNAAGAAAAIQGGGDQASEYAALTGDATKGRRVFAKCMACHTVQEGQNRVGPSLYGIIGRRAGTVDGFNYSEANANSGITWSEETMFAYLEEPQAYMPGTRMIFPGLPDAQERADVIAYLQSVVE